MKLLALLLMLPFVTIYSQGSDTLRERYDRITIYRSGNSFKIGNVKYTFREMEPQFQNSELGLLSYDKSKKYRSISGVLQVVAVGTLVGLFSAARKRDTDQMYVWMGANVVFTLSSGVLRGMSDQFMDQAIWQRNKDYLFPER